MSEAVNASPKKYLSASGANSCWLNLHGLIQVFQSIQSKG